MQFPDIQSVRAPLLRALAEPGARAMLSAPPGTGKTTRIPLDLLESSWLQDKRIVILEPRRIAARAAARHMASLLGEAVGQRVGFRVRFDTRVSQKTRIEVVTEGLLVRRLQSDPELSDVGLLIFDELHERHLDTELALALALDVAGSVRPDLRLLVMSATLDTRKVAALLGTPHQFAIGGAAFPVTTRYLGRETPLRGAVKRAIDEGPGDVLVFLPGAAEIRRAADDLRAADWALNVRVCPLYAELGSTAEQQALQPDADGWRKVVLATNIAESSLTIPGVCAVVDSGLARVPLFDPNAALTRLDTVRIARACADQRRGRAGRVAPGRCYRLWSESDDSARPAFQSPEILTADLAPLLLQLLAWGAADPAQLHWLDPLPAGALEQAWSLLGTLGATDDKRRLTPLGQRMANLPAHPRLAAMIVGAEDGADAALACRLAALIDEGSPERGPRSERPVDLLVSLELIGKPNTGSFSRERLTRLLKSERALLARLEGSGNPTVKPDQINDASVAARLIRAYPDRVARARGPRGRFLLANGRAVRVPGADRLAGAEWLVVVDAGGRSSGSAEPWVRSAVATCARVVEEHLGGSILASTDVVWDSRERAVQTFALRRLGAIELDRRPADHIEEHQVVDAMLDGIRDLGLEALPWTNTLMQWRYRVMFLAGAGVGDAEWPDVSDAALLAQLPRWLAPYLCAVRRASQLNTVNLRQALESLLVWPQPQLLEQHAPRRWRVPSGRELNLRYSADGAPVLSVPLQEMLGTPVSPTVAAGRIAVVIELLSPAGRPLQVTRDLASFWADGYREVRKEMRGRYPKHAWPEDPINAHAHRGARRRKVTP